MLEERKIFDYRAKYALKSKCTVQLPKSTGKFKAQPKTPLAIFRSPILNFQIQPKGNPRGIRFAHKSKT